MIFQKIKQKLITKSDNSEGILIHILFLPSNTISITKVGPLETLSKYICNEKKLTFIGQKLPIYKCVLQLLPSPLRAKCDNRTHIPSSPQR